MPDLFNRVAFAEFNGRRFNTRVNFSVAKTEDGKPNKGQCSVYNLSETSRSALEQKDSPIIIRAGYGGAPELLFIGDITDVSTKRQGADLITIVLAGDGEKSIAEAHVDIGLGPGATTNQLLETIKTSLGVSIGVIDGFPNVKFTEGFSFSGSTEELLNTLAKGAGSIPG